MDIRKDLSVAFSKALLEEVFGADNMYYTGQKLGRAPHPFEAARHYVRHGGREDFIRRWEEQHRLDASAL